MSGVTFRDIRRDTVSRHVPGKGRERDVEGISPLGGIPDVTPMPRAGVPAAIGETIRSRGQAYRLIEIVPHTRRDGAQTELRVWVSHCADCGAEFVTKSPASQKPEGRRCDLHKSPGRKVKP